MYVSGLKVFGNLAVLEERQPTIVSFGNFDGVHLGHRFLIQTMHQKRPDLASVVVTFFPHPASVFGHEARKPPLTMLKDRVGELLKAGAACVVVQEFTREFASQSADEFCERFVGAHFNVQHVVLGYDFSYGKEREGNATHMQAFGKKRGWNVEVCPPFSLQGEIVSSSRVRDAVQSGDVEKAEQLLGRPYALTGCIIRGDGKGRQIGWPTANLSHGDDGWKGELLPALGVYVCTVAVGVETSGEWESWPAVMNCGMRPTIGGTQRLQIEAHLLDFSGDLYGRQAKFLLKKRLRDEAKFSSLPELVEQIERDVLAARTFFQEQS